MVKRYSDIEITELGQILALSNSVLIDVRDEWEYEEFNVGGLNIPMSEIRDKRHLLLDYDHVIVACTNGGRSRIAVKDYLRAIELADKLFYHVEGGILGFE